MPIPEGLFFTQWVRSGIRSGSIVADFSVDSARSDEAQEMAPALFSELRLLSSAVWGSKSILMVVLAGDQRLRHPLQSPERLPIGSRIRTRLRTEYDWRRRSESDFDVECHQVHPSSAASHLAIGR